MYTKWTTALSLALSLSSACAQTINSCVVAVSAQKKNGDNVETARWPCIVAQFGPQIDTSKALLVAGKCSDAGCITPLCQPSWNVTTMGPISSTAEPFSACSPLTNKLATPGRWVALATRTVKNCTFYEKTINSYAAGASAALIGNDLVDSGPVPMDFTVGMSGCCHDNLHGCC